MVSDQCKGLGDLAGMLMWRAALPHAEVPAAEFFKHIAEDLTEPRRMRCLLGWCGQRALPAKPEPPKQSTAASTLEFQALQAGMSFAELGNRHKHADNELARVIQTEIAQDLITKGVLSDWFSRDEQPQQPLVLRKKPNPRNIANAAKIEELERELERYVHPALNIIESPIADLT